jgi:hypothetical protein
MTTLTNATNSSLALAKSTAAELNTTYDTLVGKIMTFNDSFKDTIDEIEGYSKTAIDEINRILDALSQGVSISGSVKIDTIFNDTKSPTGMATGGYTGNWGKDGKLAVLHEKELVLNATDTSKILDAVSLVRDLNAYTDSYTLPLTQLLSTAMGYNINNMGNDFEQNVHITADFPNVTNHLEIEQAFNNLVNMASQYANQKRY